MSKCCATLVWFLLAESTLTADTPDQRRRRGATSPAYDPQLPGNDGIFLGHTRGQIVGKSSNGSDLQAPRLWTERVIKDIQTLYPPYDDGVSPNVFALDGSEDFKIRGWESVSTKEPGSHVTTESSSHGSMNLDRTKPCGHPSAAYLDEFLQSDTVGDVPATPLNISRRRCDRECVSGEKPQLCYYKFTVEDYYSLGAACRNCPSKRSDCFRPQCVTADGNERGLLTVNRMLPGPSIQVCKGDRVVLDLHNSMPGRTTTIHFHGVFQEGSNAMDGVPMVTQCPIPEGATFRYDFFANNAGTHFWHSHDGFQKMDGIQGSLIVRIPRNEDPSSKLYDEDLPAHVILLSDWFEGGSDQKFPGLRTNFPGQEPVSYLINGRGRISPPPKANSSLQAYFAYGTKVMPASRMQQEEYRYFYSRTPRVPLATFKVTKGKRYRFRLIAGTCTHCPAEVSIAQHRLKVIATDGNAVKGVTVDRIVVLPGERYDVVLHARRWRSTYWIQVRGLGPCMVRRTSGVAVLRYKGSSLKVPSTPDPEYRPVNTKRPVTLNPYDNKCGPRDHNVCVNQLETADVFDPRLMAQNPDVNLTFNFNFAMLKPKQTFRKGSYQRFLQPVVRNALVTAFINNISNVLGGSPLVGQIQDIPPGLFCEDNKCPSGICDCLHLVKVPLDALVEMVIADEMPHADVMSHPFHLHGHKFHVLGLGQFPGGRRQPAQRRAAIDNATENALVKLRKGGTWCAGKDTIAIPPAGFAVVRWIADNPGFWMVHCHYVYHQVIGMILVLQVGELDEIPKPPPGFPTCGNFLSDVDTSDFV